MRHPGAPDAAIPAVSLVPAPARRYQGHRAGIITRCAAGAVDLTVAVLAILVAYAGWAAVLFLVRPRAFRFPEPAPGSLLTALLTVLTAYLALGWVTTGQTYGARLMGLRVVDRHGHRLGPGRALVRALLCVLFPLLLFWVLVSQENRSVLDLLLRTSVVYDWSLKPPPQPVRRGP
jgi:uncharacterized RDD family membrane protein YckC